jgi:serine/threonine-protein kinase RsbT
VTDDTRNLVSQTTVSGDGDVATSALAAGAAAASAGLGRAPQQMFATAVSELARNIVKYAGAGEIRVCEVRAGNRVGVEATARDQGPGIPDVELALNDSYSTGGTLGLGLPGVRRMMDEFEIDSDTGDGTRVRIRKWR